MHLTQVEQAILRVAWDKSNLGYEPDDFCNYPPYKLTDFVQGTNFSVAQVADALDSLKAKNILAEQLGPREFVEIGKADPENDELSVVRYRIKETSPSEEAYEMVTGKRG